jgi:hypothetical protein
MPFSERFIECNEERGVVRIITPALTTLVARQRVPSALTSWPAAANRLMLIQDLAFLVCVLLLVNLTMACWLKHRTDQAPDHAVAESAAHDIQINLMTCVGEKSAATYAEELKREGILATRNAVVCICNGGVLMKLCKLRVLFIASRVNVLPTKASADGRTAHERWFKRPFDCAREGSWPPRLWTKRPASWAFHSAPSPTISSQRTTFFLATKPFELI